MSSYVQRAITGDERILFEAELHWIVYRIGFGMTILGALFGHYAPMVVRYLLGDNVAQMISKPLSYVAVGIIVLGAFELLVAYIQQISTELVITNRRVIAKHGFISTTSYELMMSKVEGATIDQSVLGRVLGFGTLMVKGTGGGISPIDHIANPYEFHNALIKALEESTMPPSAQPAAARD